jgi:jumonji domain-containing protein 7
MPTTLPGSFSAGVRATRDQLTVVPRIHARDYTPLTFLREFVCPSKPCILLGAIDHWPALSLWLDPTHLVTHAGDATAVTLTWTPNGRADAIDEGDGTFTLPHEESVTLKEALDVMQGKTNATTIPYGSPYVSSQNGSLTRELSGLVKDTSTFLVAEEALGSPEATNVWIAPQSGTQWIPPVSSLHKDSYENLHAVVCGSKRFTLLPPTDAGYLCVKKVPVTRFVYSPSSGWGKEAVGGAGTPNSTVPWCHVDPDSPDLGAFPLYTHASPVQVTVHAGETLYLPALWYHQVTCPGVPDCPTIAVNKWFPMQFGVSYVAQQLILGLARSETEEEEDRES